MSMAGEVACSSRAAAEGALRRDIHPAAPSSLRGSRRHLHLRRWENGDSWCHFRKAPSRQTLLRDPPWQFRGILETRKERVRGLGAEVLRCSLTVSAG